MDRRGISRSQVYGWRRKTRAGKLPGVSKAFAGCAAFMPVKGEETAAAALSLPAPRRALAAPVSSRSPLEMAAASKWTRRSIPLCLHPDDQPKRPVSQRNARPDRVNDQ